MSVSVLSSYYYMNVKDFFLSFSNKKSATSVTEVYLLKIFTAATQRKM